MRKFWFVWRGVDKPMDERLLQHKGKTVLFPRKRDAKQAAKECGGRVVAQWVS